jgi:hypothetical protein
VNPQGFFFFFSATHFGFRSPAILAFGALLPHECGVPNPAGTPHLCGRAPKRELPLLLNHFCS